MRELEGDLDVLAQWIAEIETRMQLGETFDRIEDEINSAAALDDEQKAALWLFAWSCQSGAHQRMTARQLARDLIDGRFVR